MNAQELHQHATYLVDNLENVLHEYGRQPENFINRVIKPLSDALNDKKDFVFKRSIDHYATINPFDIKGSSHPDYIGMNWGELIKTGRRMHINIPLLKENPMYYLEDSIKLPQMLFTEVDGEIFVDGDGNHRSALCQLLFYAKSLTSLHGVCLTSYSTNHALRNAFLELEEERRNFKLLLSTKVYSKTLSREDGGSFMREYYDNIIEITNIKKGISIQLKTPNEVHAFIQEAKHKSFLGRFSHGKFKDFIY